MAGAGRQRLNSLIPGKLEEELMEEASVRVSDNFYTSTSGFFLRHTFDQDKKATDIVEVLYNDRMRLYVLVDVRGITTWRPQAIDESVKRNLTYPKYVYRKFVSLVFARKYNVYFALSKDFCLEILNRDFDSVCSIEAEMRNTTFMVFDNAQDELITGGMEGLKIWKYGPSSKKVYGQIKPMSNYELTLKVDLRGQQDVSSVKLAEIDSHMGYLYCCSDTDVSCFSLHEHGKLICRFNGAHRSGICGCVYSPAMQLLVTAAADMEIKLWNFAHGFTGSLTGHSRRITALRLHPDDSRLILTSSMDGSVRLWSLEVMECIYQVQILSHEGVRWMGFGDVGQIFAASQRQVLIYNVAYLPEFWAPQRAPSMRLQLVGAEGKTTRLMSVSADSSVRFFSRRSRELLSTVLTPPPISPLSRLRDFAYSRTFGFSYLLMDARKLWVYLSRSNPASRVAQWNLAEVQTQMNRRGRRPRTFSQAYLKECSAHRALMLPPGKDSRVVDCTSLACLSSVVVMWSEQGDVCPPVQEFLLLGLEDGRILFMDPIEKSLRYMEFTAGKEPILEIRHDRYHSCLLTRSLAKQAACITVWDLPSLEMLHEVVFPIDVVGFARLENSLITGHQSGHVFIQTLEPIEDNGPQASRPPPTVPASLFEQRPKPDHSVAVASVDSCPCRSFYLSVSLDGVVKLWNESQVLLSEVILEEQVVCAAFLNSEGDLILSMKSHLFLLPHQKCVMAGPADEDICSESDVAESEIIEDPAIKYEGIVADPDPVNIDNYLCPFKAELSFKFTEPPTRVEEVEVVEEPESEEETIFSSADEALYSPMESVIGGSISDVESDYLEKWTQQVHGHRRPMHDMEYEMPTFGQSPVSSPVRSESSGEPTPVPSEEEEEVDDEGGRLSALMEEEEPDDAPPPPKPKVKKEPEAVAEAEPDPKPVRQPLSKRLSAMRIDPNDIPPPRQRPKVQREPLSMPPKAPDLDAAPPKAAQTQQRRQPPERKKRRPPAQPRRKAGGKGAAKEAEKAAGPRRPSAADPTLSSGPAPQFAKVDVGEAKLSAGKGKGRRKTHIRLQELEEEPVSDDIVEEEEEEYETTSVDDAKSSRTETVSMPPPSRRRGRTPFASSSARLSIASEAGVPASGLLPSREDAESPAAEAQRRLQRVPSALERLKTEASGQNVAGSDRLSPFPAPPSRLEPQEVADLIPSDPRDESATPRMEYSSRTPGPPMSVSVRKAPSRATVSAGQAGRESSSVPVDQYMYAHGRSKSGMDYRDAKRVFGPDYARLLELQMAKYMDSMSDHPYFKMLALREDSGQNGREFKVLPPRDAEAWEAEGGDSDDEDRELLGMVSQIGVPRVGSAVSVPAARPSTAVDLGRSVSALKGDDLFEELHWALCRPRTAFPSGDDVDEETLKAENDHFQKLNQFYEKLLLRYHASRPGTPMDKLFHNDGVHPMAPDQQIERHILLRLRRQLRQHSAAEKRRCFLAEQEERRRALQGHRFCAYEPKEGEVTPQQRIVIPRASTGRADLSARAPVSPSSRPATTGLLDRDRRDKKSQTPFRFALSDAAAENENLYDLKAKQELKARVRPKYSAPSIPSKCSRYALISQSPAPESELPAPSLPEERLIRERFPQFKEQWVGDYALLEPKPWMVHMRSPTQSS